MSSAMERKLDKVLRTLENLAERMDKLDFKFDTFDNRLNKLESLFNDKINKLEQALENKSNVNYIDNIHTKLNRIEQQQLEQESKNLMQESYDKRLNVLIHGLEESNKTDWETREITQETIYEFFQKGLQIKEPRTIELIDCHRLTQSPIFKNNIKVNRPVIIKLAKEIDRRIIFSKLKNLKHYNEARKSQNKRPHYITEHLPKQFQVEGKALLPHFKEARRLNKKTSWKAENGHYNLYIENVKF